MDLLIDGDVVCHKIAYISEDKSEQYAKDAVDDYLGNAIDYFLEFLVPSPSHTIKHIFINGAESFRKGVDPEYKANRKDKAKPKHLAAIRQHLIDKHGAQVSKAGFETDDCLSYMSTKNKQKCVIVTIDKDMMQVPGYYYNLDNMTLTYNLPFACMKHFYTQMLVGDAVDNVHGIKGVGAVGAKKLLRDCVTAQQMLEVVQGQYHEEERERLDNGHPENQLHAVEQGNARMLKNARLLWLKRYNENNPVEEYFEDFL